MNPTNQSKHSHHPHSKNNGDSEYKKVNSRKYKLTLLIFFAATLMCVIPPIVAVFILKMSIPGLVIISGSEWITVMGMLGGFYFGANVWQKKIDNEFTISKEKQKIAKDSNQQQPSTPAPAPESTPSTIDQ